MARKIRWLISVGAVLLLAACSMPQTGGGDNQASGGQQSAGDGGSVSVVNDAADGVAVYMAPDGTSRNIVATDPGTNQPVKCVSATAFTQVSDPMDSSSGQKSVLVFGNRSDGTAGAWEVDSHGAVSLVAKDNGGAAGCLTPSDSEAPHGLYRHLGWEYHVTATDGRMAVGYAENVRGFSFGPISIPAGTTVGIYWNLSKGRFDHHWRISPPYVIGSWAPPRSQNTHHYHSWLLNRLFSSLKMFFLDQLQSYLIMATGVTFDAANNDYVVTGTDQDGNDATATISSNGGIVIEEVVSPPPPPTGYSEIVIQTFNPMSTTSTAYAPNLPVIQLFTSSGVSTSVDPWPNSNAATGAVASDLATTPVTGTPGLYQGTNIAPQQGWPMIDYTTPPGTSLPSGTVLYVRISGYDAVPGDNSGGAAWSGYYGIRVLATPGTSYTALTANITDSPYEPDNPPNSGDPTSITAADSITTLDNTVGFSRYLGPGDVDWIKITLP